MRADCGHVRRGAESDVHGDRHVGYNAVRRRQCPPAAHFLLNTAANGQVNIEGVTVNQLQRPQYSNKPRPVVKSFAGNHAAHCKGLAGEDAGRTHRDGQAACVQIQVFDFLRLVALPLFEQVRRQTGNYGGRNRVCEQVNFTGGQNARVDRAEGAERVKTFILRRDNDAHFV
jgi:hypothetical protein